MSTTTLDSACLVFPTTSTATIMSALDSGWVCLQYRKANGQVVQRLGTRNPSILKAYALQTEIDALDQYRRDYGIWGGDSILYWDYCAGGLRSYSRIDLLAAGIPESAPEINH